MSLDKAIKHGKERRKAYWQRGKAGDNDRTCRPHGAGFWWPCPYCEGNRLFTARRQDEQARQALQELADTSQALNLY